MMQPVSKVSRIPISYAVALIPVAAALNLLGSNVNSTLRLPTFLDMIGTGVVAMTLGPWWGALVGLVSNVTKGMLHSPVNLPFSLSNVAGALVWGYGIRWGMGKSLVRFAILSLMVAFGVSVSAVPIYVFVYGGATGHYRDIMTAALVGMGKNLWLAVFSTNIVVSIADKVTSSFLALAIIEALPQSIRTQGPIIKSEKVQRVIWIVVGACLGMILVLTAMFLKRK